MIYQITRVTNAAATASERGQNQLLVGVADVISVSGVAAENRGRLGSPETADGQDRGGDDRSENGGLPECNHTRQSFNLDSGSELPRGSILWHRWQLPVQRLVPAKLLSRSWP